jgi:hypothetical protein
MIDKEEKKRSACGCTVQGQFSKEEFSVFLIWGQTITAQISMARNTQGISRHSCTCSTPPSLDFARMFRTDSQSKYTQRRMKRFVVDQMLVLLIHCLNLNQVSATIFVFYLPSVYRNGRGLTDSFYLDSCYVTNTFILCCDYSSRKWVNFIPRAYLLW